MAFACFSFCVGLLFLINFLSFKPDSENNANFENYASHCLSPRVLVKTGRFFTNIMLCVYRVHMDSWSRHYNIIKAKLDFYWEVIWNHLWLTGDISAHSIVLRASWPQHDDDEDVAVTSQPTADSDWQGCSDSDAVFTSPTASVPAIDHLHNNHPLHH